LPQAIVQPAEELTDTFPASVDVATQIAVGIVTCNREDSVLRCVRSLSRLGTLVREVIVVDNGSSKPVADWLSQADQLPDVPLRIIRLEGYLGPIAARNRIAEMASAELLLSLDDDTEILDPDAVQQAIAIILRDQTIGAVAFAQVAASGDPWPAEMQPAPVDYACRVPAFIGCAALLRLSVFVRLGGYRELLDYYGEEKEYCLRLLGADYSVVYLPSAGIAHLADPLGRSLQKYYRYYVRNDCMTALLNYPWPLALYVVLRRSALYHRIARRHLQLDDPGGRRWLWGQLTHHRSAILQQRKPLAWRTLLKWQSLKAQCSQYQRPGA